MILLPLFRPVQQDWKTTGQDGNIAAHLSLLGAAGIWGGVLLYIAYKQPTLAKTSKV